jgi:lauroyl/myristoyl acyltransferase
VTSVTELTARFTAAIEAAIRRTPSDWVWWHERWRRQPASLERAEPSTSTAPA